MEVSVATLTRDDIFKRMVPHVIARGEELLPEDVTKELRFDDGGIDSIKLVALIGDLEIEFGFKVPDSARKDALPETVEELLDRIVLRLTEAGIKVAT